MRIYIATTAPGTEEVQPHGFVYYPYRLLSYYHINHGKFACDKCFDNILKFNADENIFGRRHGRDEKGR